MRVLIITQNPQLFYLVMKKLVLIITGLAACGNLSAQLDWGGVPVIPDSYCQKISKDGVLVAGETIDGSYYTHNTLTGKEEYYIECHGGMGNCIAANGWMVGNDKNTSKGVILYEGEIIPISSLQHLSESYLSGITWDGSRICGITINPKLGNSDFTSPDFDGQMYVPVILDVDNEGNIGDPFILPHPDKDFFNATPQFCSAVWISDDGKTVAGQVIDDTGFYMYPIVYKADAEGNWSYSLPSEALFNTEGYPIPQYPKFEMAVYQVQDFMTPEEREEFEEALENWTDDDNNPYLYLELFMTPEELEAYEEWYDEYMEYSWYYNNFVLPEYYAELVKVILCSTFFEENSLALNSEGTMLAMPQSVAYFVEGQEMPVNYYIPFIFDLEKGTYRIVPGEVNQLNTNQILPDGTLVACTPNVGAYNGDETPVHSYVLLPGAEKFTAVDEWMESKNKSYYDWYMDYLFHDVPVRMGDDGQLIYKSMTVTGLVAISDDMNVVAGGVDGWSWDWETGFYFSYILNNVSSGVKDLTADEDNSMITVFNLHGVKVMETGNKENLSKLGKGIYIVNGKKVAL